MTNSPLPACIAFAGPHRIAAGSLAEVAARVKARLDAGESAPVLVFDADGRQIELDLRGTAADVQARLHTAVPCVPPVPIIPEVPPIPAVPAVPETRQGPGRPRLGVVAREVTLLPRHWDWLASQPGGASVALRKLVEEARRQAEPQDRLRQRQEAVYRFMSVMAGDLPGYEEALRAFYAWDRDRLAQQMAAWPDDIRQHVEQMIARI